MNQDKGALLSRGAAIPASPLALDKNRRFDERRQAGLYEYYAAAGAGGVAVAVHTTQFEIREPRHGLLRPVLELAARTLAGLEERHGRPIIRVAGVCGATAQAAAEAELAASLDYDVALLSLAAMRTATDDELIAHCETIARIIPLIGFYLQPAVGGRPLSYNFWRRFAEITNVLAIKIAPFDRYKTLDVVRAVADAGAEDRITLYTGNDDNIISDLVTPFVFGPPGKTKTLRIRGGLLGQWSVWTKTFATLLDDIHGIADSGAPIPSELITKNAQLTDANAAIFDASHNYAGCIPGIHEILRRQGLLDNIYCLNSDKALSPGQSDEIDRVIRDYPWLPDDDFVRGLQLSA
ncbi:MAG: dihydrodipicolinate synthase family protein [bacterium]|nr:dihydrodipicolinate synthase family protein [Candidatus Sumerlaeota bacterium]